MAKFNDKNSKLIEALRETGIVSYACKKVGINRSTFYRWWDTIPSFRAAAEEAIAEGIKNICDLAKSMLIKKVKEESMDAIKYVLSNNDPQYTPKRTVFVEPMTSEDRRLIKTIRSRQALAEEEAKKEIENPRNMKLEEIMKKLSPEERELLLDIYEEDMRQIRHGLI